MEAVKEHMTEEQKDVKIEKPFLTMPVCYFELSDGFVVLYEFSVERIKNFNLDLAEVEQGTVFLRFFNENEKINLAFPVDRLIDFISRKKIENVSIALYNFQGYGNPAEYISTVTIPVETVYEIKGAVELLRAKKINHLLPKD